MPTKHRQIKHTQSACVIDDYITPRVTSWGYSADLASESIEELGNPNIVETLDDTPTISSTLDLNDYGSVETLAVLANRYQYPDTGSGWLGGDGTSWSITNSHFEVASVDLLNHIKAGADDALNDRAVWLNNCTITSYSATYSVDGFATESVSLENSSEYQFINSYKYARVLRPVVHYDHHTGAGACDGTRALLVSPSVGDSTTYSTFNYNNVLGDLWKNTTGVITGIYLTEDGVIQNSADWATDGTWVYSPTATIGNIVFAASSRYRLVARHAGLEADSTNFAGPTATGRAGLRKGNAKLYFWDSGSGAAGSSAPTVGSSFYSKRIQSISVDVSWNREQLEQLGEHEPYFRGVESTEITATINAIGSNAELFAIAAGKGVDGTSFYSDEINEMNLTDFQSATNLSARIDVFNTTDTAKHVANNRCKYITLTGGKVTTFGQSIDVPGRLADDLTVTFNTISWFGDKIIAARDPLTA